jgi:hypothetical protein
MSESPFIDAILKLESSYPLDPHDNTRMYTDYNSVQELLEDASRFSETPLTEEDLLEAKNTIDTMSNCGNALALQIWMKFLSD